MKTDEYGEVINSEETYQAIAEILQIKGSCLIGWTDEQGSHFDILFSYLVSSIPAFGTIQGGVRGSDLFVSVMRNGAFGFELRNSETYWTYYDEKLNVKGSFGETTGRKMADLINGVKRIL